MILPISTSLCSLCVLHQQPIMCKKCRPHQKRKQWKKLQYTYSYTEGLCFFWPRGCLLLFGRWCSATGMKDWWNIRILITVLYVLQNKANRNWFWVGKDSNDSWCKLQLFNCSPLKYSRRQSETISYSLALGLSWKLKERQVLWMSSKPKQKCTLLQLTQP